ncbi:MAG: transposase [Bacteroidota bacterium]
MTLEYERTFMKHRDFGPTPVHITDRLYGSIPRAVIAKHNQAMRERLAQIARTTKHLPINERRKAQQVALTKLRNEQEAKQEKWLHKAANGPYYLRNPAIARLVIEAWKYQTKARGLVVIAICVMSNHAHILASGPASGLVVPCGPVLNSAKTYSARMANRILGRTGNPFWEHTYFDRDVRSGTFMTVLWYILNNPVKAGFVKDWRDWPHTYLNPEYTGLVSD